MTVDQERRKLLHRAYHYRKALEAMGMLRVHLGHIGIEEEKEWLNLLGSIGELLWSKRARAEVPLTSYEKEIVSEAYKAHTSAADTPFNP